MSESEHLAARAACEALFHDVHGLIDDGRASEAIDRFTDDAVFEVRGTRYEGRIDILRFLTDREAMADRHTRHAGANFRFRRTGDAAAEASALLIVFVGEGPGPHAAVPEAVTDCEMTFRWTPAAGWRLSSRLHRRFAAGHRR